MTRRNFLFPRIQDPDHDFCIRSMVSMNFVRCIELYSRNITTKNTIPYSTAANGQCSIVDRVSVNYEFSIISPWNCRHYNY